MLSAPQLALYLPQSLLPEIAGGEKENVRGYGVSPEGVGHQDND